MVMVVDNRMMIMIESSLSQTLSIKEPVKYAELDDSPIFRSAQHTAAASYSRSSVEADFWELHKNITPRPLPPLHIFYKKEKLMAEQAAFIANAPPRLTCWCL